MQWLLHGSLAGAVAEALRRHGHQAHELSEVGLATDAPAEAVLKAAQEKQYDLVTTAEQVAQAPYAMDLWFHRSIVYLQLAGGEVEQDDAVDRLFARYKRLTPGRLYTVTETRVKVRQLPARRPGK
jgi:hypothetical protein